MNSEEIIEALRPFAHPDLLEELGGNAQGEDSPVYGRNKATLRLGDFRRAARVLEALSAQHGAQPVGYISKADHERMLSLETSLSSAPVKATILHVSFDEDSIPLCTPPASAPVKESIKLIADERERQQVKEGWSDSHDDEHDCSELAIAAACYALGEPYVHIPKPANSPRSIDDIQEWTKPQRGQIEWPWDKKWWKPKSKLRDLVRAGALVSAEIDRILRENSDV